MRKFKILIADDELGVQKLLSITLRDRDYDIVTASDGMAALAAAERETPDLVILDKRMPKLDGLEVCNRLREWTQIPIMMLSADSNIETKIACLEAGADDYVCKPFNIEEVTARISAILRRSQNIVEPTKPVMSAGDILIDFGARTVMKAGKEVQLTRTEFALLRELAVNVGKVLSHTDLLKKVWGNEYSGETEYLRVFINRLRAKLESNPANPRYIVTTSGIGYMFNRRTSDRVLEHQPG
jgi:two-component system, OmpR family, KDP operon response regulator KdpE